MEIQTNLGTFLGKPPLAELGSGDNSGSKKSEYQEIVLGCKALPARKADNLTAICESIF
jgi:hypothetical protein